MREKQCEADCQFFINLGSRILAYPLNRNKTFYFECVRCKQVASYLGIPTFIRRSVEPLCYACAKIKAGETKIKKAREEVVSFLSSRGSILIKYTKQLEAITLTCAGCQKEFTYSTYNNLLKRNRECLCEGCRGVATKAEKINKTGAFLSEKVEPVLRAWGLYLLEPYPKKKEEALYISCFYCKQPHRMSTVHSFIFNLKDPDFRPTCDICRAKKISETQRKNNFPAFLKKMQMLFRENNSKLLNKPQNEKQIFEFICSKCNKKSLRRGLSFFKENPGNFICVECSFQEAGLQRRKSLFPE